MKRFGLWVVALALCAAPAGRAQDAATEERLKQLSGKVEDLIAGQEVLRKRIEELAAQLENLREQQSRPTPNYAGVEDLKGLAKAIEQVDSKRIEDNQKIRADLLRLIDAVKAAPVAPQKKPRAAASSSGSRKNNPPPSDNPGEDKGGGSERGFNHRVAAGETISGIVAACREKHIMVTVEQILKANPRVKPNSLRVDTDLFIPLPQPENPSQ
jgi:TolA-binding protein